MDLVAATEELVRLSKTLHQKVTTHPSARKMSGTIRISLPDLEGLGLPAEDRAFKG
jgi:hypothetical protein